MLGHLGLSVGDLARARQRWGVLMPVLGFEVFLDDADQVAYRPAGGKPGTYLFLYPATDAARPAPGAVGLQHLAFMVPTRRTVRDVHALAIELGAATVHEPQVFPQYPQPYYAAFWRDEEGVLMEAVCHHDR